MPSDAAISAALNFRNCEYTTSMVDLAQAFDDFAAVPVAPSEAPQPPADLSDRAALAAWLSAMGRRLSLSKGLTRDGAALTRAGEMLGACRCEGTR